MRGGIHSMQINIFKANNIFYNSIILLFCVLLFSTTQTTTNAWAGVTGSCDICHTMHNSQDGTNVVRIGAGAGWNGGVITGGSSTAPPGQLLVSDCVGCHTNSQDDRTIVTIAGNNIPIVYNSSGAYPGSALAGGNFFGTPTDSTLGHNVRGIAPIDAVHNGKGAPGFALGVGCAGSCHWDLTLSDAATVPSTTSNINTNGCRGCHLKINHHDPANVAYRGLGGHGVITYVHGEEDPDWEHTFSSNDHNTYKRDQYTDADPEPIYDGASIGLFCAGCHNLFHAWGATNPMLPLEDNGGDWVTNRTAGANPWLRHPTNVDLPNDLTPGNDYEALLAGTAYNPKVPVAQDMTPGVIPEAARDTVEPGDQVFCLSCHRAHASDQPDALRFNYQTMLSHNGNGDPDGDGINDGCFYCHSPKADL